MSSFKSTALAVLVFALLSPPHTHGQALRFDVTSVKPRPPGMNGPARSIRGKGVLELPNETVWSLVRFAYKIEADAQLIGSLPDWAYTEAWAISAKAASSIPDEQLPLMAQTLLEDRFGMAAHWEDRPLSHLEVSPLTPDKKLGPNILSLQNRDECSSPDVRARGVQPNAEPSQGGCGPVAGMIQLLSELTGQVVVDKTGFKFVLYRLFGLPGGFASMNQRLPPSAKVRADVDAVRHAVRDQLGLQLQPSRTPIPALVITAGPKRPEAN